MAEAEYDPKRHREAWTALDVRERRRILKGVNRGQRFEDRRDARLAVGIATNQMRFWRWAWLLAPVGALFQLGRGFTQFAVNLVVAGVVLGGLSWWFHRRAARAREVNLEVLRSGRKGTKGKKGRRGG